MRRCPKCKALNEDQYLYCFKCNSPLPPKYKIDALVDRGRSEMERKEYRGAMRSLEEALKMNPGDKEILSMLAVVYKKLKMFRDMREAFDDAGIRYREVSCTNCRGTGICPDCDGQKICLMCNGRGKCHMCNGTGVCFVCHGNDPQCPACGGSGECPRCGGSGECSYCNGTGACGSCHGDGMCSVCGGRRVELRVELSTIPPQYRKYFRNENR